MSPSAQSSEARQILCARNSGASLRRADEDICPYVACGALAIEKYLQACDLSFQFLFEFADLRAAFQQSRVSTANFFSTIPAFAHPITWSHHSNGIA